MAGGAAAVAATLAVHMVHHGGVSSTDRVGGKAGRLLFAWHWTYWRKLALDYPGLGEYQRVATGVALLPTHAE